MNPFKHLFPAYGFTKKLDALQQMLLQHKQTCPKPPEYFVINNKATLEALKSMATIPLSDAEKDVLANTPHIPGQIGQLMGIPIVSDVPDTVTQVQPVSTKDKITKILSRLTERKT